MAHGSPRCTSEITWIQPHANSYFKSILEGIFSLFPRYILTNKCCQGKPPACGATVVPKFHLGS